MNVLLDELKARLGMLEADLASITKQAAAFRHAIARYEQQSDAETRKTQEPKARRVPKEVRNNIVQILREEGGALHYKQIYERLKDRGVIVRGANPARNVIAHMSIDDRFRNVRPGVWGLISQRVLL